MEGRLMDRQRFEQLLETYGADMRRWPATECSAAASFLARSGGEAAEALHAARALDAALNHARGAPDTAALEARILAAATPPRQVFDMRAALALAACAVFGVLLGYGGGRLAPVADQDESYFEAAFAAPLGDAFGEEG